MAGIERERQMSRQAVEDLVGPPVPESVRRRNNAVRDINDRLIEQENSKTNPKGGWNEAEKKWYPHDSAEGGAKTIAYGVKLSNGSKWAKTAQEQGFLTDEQAQDAVWEMSNAAYESAKKRYNKRYPNDANAWDNLNHKQQSILADYEYNGVLKKFGKFMDAMHDGDIEAMRRESPRYSGTKPLTRRNERILRDIDSLETHYPIPGR